MKNGSARGRKLLPMAGPSRAYLAPSQTKPLLARLICAAAGMSGASVGDLARRTGLSAKNVSQLRSSARGELGEAKLLLAELGLDADTLISRLERAEAKHPGQLDELLALLILAFPARAAAVHASVEGTVTCDKLALIVPERVVVRCDALLSAVRASGQRDVLRNYVQTFYYRGVTFGIGIRWKPWFGTGLRLEFNPSKLSRRGARLVRSFVAATPEAELRVSRVDVAVDQEVPIGWMQPLGTSERKHTIIGTGRRIETIYLGSRNARLSFAIYDKAAERGETDVDSMKPLTRIEARHKKRSLRPSEMIDLVDPFRNLRLLWLDGDALDFPDRVLLLLARLMGLAFLKRELSEAHFTRLATHCATQARTRRIASPSIAYAAQWPHEARRVLRRIGVRCDADQNEAEVSSTQLWRWRLHAALGA